jgi:hypothetical protein
MKSTVYVLLAALSVLPPVAQAQDGWGSYTLGGGALNLGFRDDAQRWVIPSQPIAPVQPAAPVQPPPPLVQLPAPVQLTPAPEPVPAAAPPVPNLFLAAAVTPIPEPTTSALLLAGLGVVGLLYRRRSRK